MPYVNSSVIRRIEYDEDTSDLFVTFTSGKVYVYARVPADVYEDFVAADSHGEFFNEHIKDQYPFTEAARRQ